MTRLWLVEPENMCFEHLLTEHEETHMFLEEMEEGTDLHEFAERSMFFGAEFLKSRHDNLAAHITNHQSPLLINKALILAYPQIDITTVDVRTSLIELFSRCPDCRKENGL